MSCFILLNDSDFLICIFPVSAYELQEPSSTFYSAQTKASLISRLDRLTSNVYTELSRQGFVGDRVSVERMLNMRFEGTDTALMVLPEEKDGDGHEDFEAAFKRVYKSEFGFLLETKSIIVDDIKVGRVVRKMDGSDSLRFDAGPRHWEDIR